MSGYVRSHSCLKERRGCQALQEVPETEKRIMETKYLIFKIAEDRPASLLGDHQILEKGGVLIPHPKKGRHHVDLRPGLVGDVTRTQGQIQVLDKK